MGAGTAAVPPPLPVLEPAPPFPASCTAQRLALPDGYPPKSVVSGGDPTGRYIIGRGYPGIVDEELPTYSSLLWDNGVPIPLNVPGAETIPADVNSRGEVVVTSVLGTDAGFYYHDGTLTRLAGKDVRVAAINEAGAIVGSVSVPAPQPTGPVDPLTGFRTRQTRPALWRTPTAEPELLGPADLTGTAVGIDDDGTVTVAAGEGDVATPGDGSPLRLVRIGPDGSVGAVATPQGVTFNQVRDYDGGWVLTGYLAGGDSTVNLGVTFALWHLSAPEQVVTPNFFGGAVNRNGWLAGTVGQFLTPEQSGQLVAPDGTTVVLPHLTGQYSDYVPLAIWAVSDDGHVVAGQVTDTSLDSSGDDDDIAVAWHCS